MTVSDLAAKLHVDEEKVRAWEAGGEISLAQAEKLAHVTHTPFGYLFLPELPVDHAALSIFCPVSRF